MAVACGEPSGIWVLDVDSLDALSSLEKVHGTLPKTWTAETGSLLSAHLDVIFSEFLRLGKSVTVVFGWQAEQR
ncbi:MAG: bifunctional DNA primase/polymerase [Pirellulales bacterium]